MTQRQYLRALNSEIQKLNGIIDDRIMHEKGYRREAIRHKRLIREVRRAEMNRSLIRLFNFFRPSWL